MSGSHRLLSLLRHSTLSFHRKVKGQIRWREVGGDTWRRTDPIKSFVFLQLCFKNLHQAWTHLPYPQSSAPAKGLLFFCFKFLLQTPCLNIKYDLFFNEPLIWSAGLYGDCFTQKAFLLKYASPDLRAVGAAGDGTQSSINQCQFNCKACRETARSGFLTCVEWCSLADRLLNL